MEAVEAAQEKTVAESACYVCGANLAFNIAPHKWKIIKMKNTLWIVVFIGLMGAGAGAQAAVIELNYDLRISNFAAVLGASAEAPFDPVYLSFSLSFDNSADVIDSTEGITASSISIPTAAAVGYTYLITGDGFFLGVTNSSSSFAGTVRSIVPGVNDWALLIGNVSTTPTLVAFFYSTAGQNTVWRADTFELITSEVPEPGVLALFGIGLMAMGLARHRRSRSRR